MIETIRWQGTHEGEVVLVEHSATDGERHKPRVSFYKLPIFPQIANKAPT